MSNRPFSSLCVLAFIFVYGMLNEACSSTSENDMTCPTSVIEQRWMVRLRTATWKDSDRYNLRFAVSSCNVPSSLTRGVNLRVICINIIYALYAPKVWLQEARTAKQNTRYKASFIVVSTSIKSVIQRYRPMSADPLSYQAEDIALNIDQSLQRL
jgi:hypothetical protein